MTRPPGAPPPDTPDRASDPGNSASGATDAASIAASEGVKVSAPRGADLRDGLQKLATSDGRGNVGIGARLRNYFLTGLLVVGPVTITIYIIWWLINVADAWIKPFVPEIYLPETYLPFAVPGISILFGIAGLTLVGALTANLLGRTLVSFGEQVLGRMPIVRNVYKALKQIFESAVSAGTPTQAFQRVGVIEFPSKGLWSLVFVTGETGGEISAIRPGGEGDLLTVFMPTGIVPPTGFICFVPRKDVTLLQMSAEDAAKIVISAGMVTPDYQTKLQDLADAARAQMSDAAPPLPSDGVKPTVTFASPTAPNMDPAPSDKPTTAPQRSRRQAKLR